MPASLLEAFSSPSIGGTESLHNPRYELELDRKGPSLGLSGSNFGSNLGSNLKSNSGLVPSPGRISDNSYQNTYQGYPQNINSNQGNHQMFGAQVGSGQIGGMCGSRSFPGNSRLVHDDRSSVSLDNETKCDLHLYHILSCKTCRDKLKALLNCNDNKTVVVREPEPRQNSIPANQVNQLLEGLLGLNINEKIQNALSKNQPAVQQQQQLQQQQQQQHGRDNLLLYIIIGLGILYLLDLIIRRRWFQQ